MLVVTVCSLCNTAVLIVLLAGIVAGFYRARLAVAATLTSGPLVSVTTVSIGRRTWLPF